MRCRQRRSNVLNWLKQKAQREYENRLEESGEIQKNERRKKAKRKHEKLFVFKHRRGLSNSTIN